MVVSEAQHTAMESIGQAAALNHQPRIETSAKDVPQTGQPVWEMEMVIERPQGSPEEVFQYVTSEEEAEDLRRVSDEGEGGNESLREETRTTRHGYDCATVAPSLAYKLEKTDEDSVLSQSLSGSVQLGAQPELLITPPMQVHEHGQLFDPQTLQTVVTSCEIPEQRTSLEGSQVSERVFCKK